MTRGSKDFFLSDTKLGEAIFRFYFLLVAFTFILGLLLTHRVIEIPEFIKNLSVQILLLGMLLWIHFYHQWRPLWGSKKKAIGYSVALVVLYFGILYAVNFFLPARSESASMPWKFQLSQYQIVALLILAPINEELFFRDLLFRSQNSRWGAFWLSALFSSFAFMVAHLSLYPGAFLLGIISCFVFIISGSIVPSMVFHFLSNASLFFIPQWFPSIAQYLVDIGLFPAFYR